MQLGNEPETEPGNEHDRFEHYLRQFQPRPPAPLPPMMTQASRTRPLLAVAALVLVACGLAVWMTVPPVRLDRPMTGTMILPRAGDMQPIEAISLGRLNALLNEDPSRLDAALAEASRHLLPDVRRSDGSLWVLAQE